MSETTNKPGSSASLGRQSTNGSTVFGDAITKQDIYDDDIVDPVYRAKAHVINGAMAQIGMGKYQWCLWVVAGFGWFADSVWPLLSGLILVPATNEFKFTPPFLSLALNIGLFVGAIFWGIGCDIWGRRWSFNLTLLITGVFGLCAGAAPNFITLASLFAVAGVGVGGNLPIDSAVFLEFVPASHQYLLTLMAIYWSVGQLLASLIAWPLIADISCATASDCKRSDNMGWRYLLFTLGGLTLLMWGLRFAVFPLYESPRFLIGRGRDAEAVDVIQRVAAYNGVSSDLTVEMLREVDERARSEGESMGRRVLTEESNYRWHHVRALFENKKMARSTSLLIAIWGILGLASTLYNSFLPYLLASRGARFGDSSVYITYRNNFIISCIGMPGAFLSAWTVELPILGRRGTLAAASGLTGAFLYASTTARSSDALLGWNCGYSFFSNILFGVLYAISPEIFPGKDRGTGNALTATATRLFGIIAPIIALYAKPTTAVPVYVSGGLIFLVGILALLLPFEPQGRASL